MHEASYVSRSSRGTSHVWKHVGYLRFIFNTCHFHTQHASLQSLCLLFFPLLPWNTGWRTAGCHPHLLEKKWTCMCLTFITLEPGDRSRFKLFLRGVCCPFSGTHLKKSCRRRPSSVIPLFILPPCSFLALVARQHQVVFGGTEKYWGRNSTLSARGPLSFCRS